MKNRLIALAVVLVMLAIGPLSVASAADTFQGISVPVTGTFTDAAGGAGKFSGTLTILRVAVVDNTLQAVGSISGTLTDSQGNVVTTGLQTVSLPLTVGTGTSAAAGGTGQMQSERSVAMKKASFNHSQKAFLAEARSAPVPQASCQILRLSIGAIDLNLLGLVVHLNPVLLVITAVPGPGNLLGNLLCAIANLLNGGGPLTGLATLLNQLLALLGG